MIILKEVLRKQRDRRESREVMRDFTLKGAKIFL
jgi:hypothetical protein